METLPEVGVSMSERMLSRVDFPHPEGPTIETNTCPETSKLTSWSARTRPSPVPKFLKRCWTAISAMLDSALLQLRRSADRRAAQGRGRGLLIDDPCQEVRLGYLLGLGPPTEDPPGESLEYQPLEEQGEEDEEERVADHALCPMSVEPVLDVPSGAAGGGEDLGEHQPLPSVRETVPERGEEERHQ